MVEFKIDASPKAIERLAGWIQADVYHKDQTIDQWLDGGLLCCWIYDKDGPVVFMKLELEEHLVRLHTQFAPITEVGKLRVAKTILSSWPRVCSIAQQPDVKGIAFQSTSPTLISFMKKLGFKDWRENDFLFSFREN